MPLEGFSSSWGDGLGGNRLVVEQRDWIPFLEATASPLVLSTPIDSGLLISEAISGKGDRIDWLRVIS